MKCTSTSGRTEIGGETCPQWVGAVASQDLAHISGRRYGDYDGRLVGMCLRLVCKQLRLVGMRGCLVGMCFILVGHNR